MSPADRHNARMRTLRFGALALVLVLAVSSCGGSDDPVPSPAEPTATPSETPSPTPSPAPSPSPTPSVSEAPLSQTECPNEEDALANLKPGRIAGDLDNDGAKDVVRIAVDETAPVFCQAFLVARTATGTLVHALEEQRIDFSVGFPRLDSVRFIDDQLGGEIVVGVVAGASTQFVAVYTVIDGAIQKVDFSGPRGPGDDLLAYGGSVGHLDAVDCVEETVGSVVLSYAVPRPEPGRYTLVRSYYRPDSTGVMVEDRAARERKSVRDDQIGSLPEFAASPFGSCIPA